MSTNQALVKRDQLNGNGLAVSAQPVPKPATAVPPLTEELVDEILAGRDVRGWLRAARVARVLGLFSLYLFLDTYDIRADFNQRAVTRKRKSKTAKIEAGAYAASAMTRLRPSRLAR